MNRAEKTAICIDTSTIVGEKGDTLLLNPGQLHSLVTEIRKINDLGGAFLTPRENIIRAAGELSREVHGWLISKGDFKREGHEVAQIQWFGIDEQDGISSFSFLLGHGNQPDIMELSSMDFSGRYKKPITYLRGVPCTEPNEVVSVSTRFKPSETQLRSLAELSLISGVPHLISEMLSNVGQRTFYNAMRSVSAECTDEGLPLLKLTSPEIAFFSPFARQTS
ncbi:MAG: hypothetical protein RLZZ455_965 [Candidatus Parcubacteria bacterium]|jgi:hypothetical protein